jgi:hypothetical protein
MTVSTPDSEKWMIGPTPGQKVGAGDGNTFVRGESDKIELLLKENHDLGHVNNALTEHNSELQARVKVLEEALLPFADQADLLNNEHADENALSECYLVIRELTARDIRRAKDTLNK